MALPTDPAIEAFLSGCELVADQPSTPFLFYAEKPLAHTTANLPALYIRLPQSALEPDSAIRLLARELRAAGCADSDGVAISFLGLLAATRDPQMTAVDFANRCLRTTCVADLHQVFVLATKVRPEYDLTLGPAHLRPFDPFKILYWSKRGQCAYPMDLKGLQGNACLQRERFSTAIITWEDVPGAIQRLETKWGSEVTLTVILDSYFQEVFRYHATQLHEMIKRSLLVLEAGALLHIDVDSLLTNPFTSSIGLFTWRGASRLRGWALLSQHSLFHTNFMPPELLTQCKLWLKEELGFDDLSVPSSLASSIASYCNILQRAHDHRLKGDVNEAFMHFVISLDLLLGVENQSTDSIASRAAALVHRQLNRSLELQVREMKRLYAVRSKFVHRGAAVPSESLVRIEEICTEILWCLLSASAESATLNIEGWWLQIDFVSAALKAGRDISLNDLTVIGVPIPGRQRRPPNRVLARPAALFAPLMTQTERSRSTPR